jgi:hypothetical protein
MKQPRILSALGSWKYVVRERALKLAADHASPFPPTWPLNADNARDLLVRWPVEYQWSEAHHWVRHLLSGMRRLVRVERVPIAQPYEGLVMIEVVVAGQPRKIAIDYGDYMDRIERSALDEAALYFKMQYLREGYGSAKVVPGGYVNPAQDYYKYVGWLRSVNEGRPPRFDVYGRFGLRFAAETRRRAVEILRAQDRFRYEGDVAIVRYTRSLEEAAQAKICIDLPGNGDFCFRLIDYLGIGACVIAPRHRTTLHVPLEDKQHVVFAREDLSDLVDLCEYYLEHDDERAAIARRSREFFDRNLHRDQLAGYYLTRAIQALATDAAE